MVESSVKLEMEEKKKSDPDGLLAVNTDDENEEIEYEAWKFVTRRKKGKLHPVGKTKNYIPRERVIFSSRGKG